MKALMVILVVGGALLLLVKLFKNVARGLLESYRKKFEHDRQAFYNEMSLTIKFTELYSSMKTTKNLEAFKETDVLVSELPSEQKEECADFLKGLEKFQDGLLDLEHKSTFLPSSMWGDNETEKLEVLKKDVRELRAEVIELCK